MYSINYDVCTKIMLTSIKTKKCSIEDCDGFVHAKGYCHKHYGRFKVHGDPLIVKCKPNIKSNCKNCNKICSINIHKLCKNCYNKEFKKGNAGSQKPCSVHGCNEMSYHRKASLCSKHYDRYKRTKNFDVFYREDGAGTIDREGYFLIYKNGKQVKYHRVVMEEFLGRKLNSQEVVHHKDGNKLNNDISNLYLTDMKIHNLLGGLERVFRLPIEDAKNLLSLVELQFEYKIILKKLGE